MMPGIIPPNMMQMMFQMMMNPQMQTMMPKVCSTSHPGMELIRPMYLIKEDDIIIERKQESCISKEKTKQTRLF